MSFQNIIDSFSESFVITEEPNDTNRTHPKYNPKYNNRLKNGNKSKEEVQEIRRKQFIEKQKENRNQIVMKLRQLLDENDFEDNCSELMDTTSDQKPKTKNRYYINKYKNQLMLSEWLVDIPEDFTHNWFLLICPIGKRCLVISSRGQTKAYSRTGYLMNTFGSLLPGGNRKTGRDSKQNSIIDCIFCEIQRVYYVLDVMSWNGSNFYDCDTEFRFFWLHSKFETECQEVSQRSHLNRFPFIALKPFGCTEPEIVSALTSQHNFSSGVDGLLFYHKKSLYTPGVTPLANWLKPDMVSDVLNIAIKR